jgi:hypothetical protein
MVRCQRNGVTVAKDVKAFDCEKEAERFAVGNDNPENVVKYCTDAKWHITGDCEAVAAKSGSPKSTRNRNCPSKDFLKTKKALDHLEAAMVKSLQRDKAARKATINIKRMGATPKTTRLQKKQTTSNTTADASATLAADSQASRAEVHLIPHAMHTCGPTRTHDMTHTHTHIHTRRAHSLPRIHTRINPSKTIPSSLHSISPSCCLIRDTDTQKTAHTHTHTHTHRLCLIVS